MQIKPVSRLAPDHQHELTLLEPRLLTTHADYRAKQRWQGEFAIAAWVRFPEGLWEPVELVVSYRDQERRKTYRVDACQPNRQTLILLNGTVNLDIIGEVEEMTLALKGLSEDAAWILDECHMEPSQKIAQKPTGRAASQGSSKKARLG